MKIVRNALNRMQRLYFPEIAKGLALTFRIMFRKRFTRQYPEQPPPKTVATRGQPRLAQQDDGTLRCVACGLCEFVCPAFAIQIDGGETDRTIEREPKKYEINMLRCILCGFCEEACPKEAIYMSDELELADHSRQDHLMGIDKLARPVPKLDPRIQYTRKIYDKWETPSSTSSPR